TTMTIIIELLRPNQFICIRSVLDFFDFPLFSYLRFPSVEFRKERTVRNDGRTATQLFRRNVVFAPRWATSAGSVVATSRDEQGAGEQKRNIAALFPPWPFRSGGLKSPAPGWRGMCSPGMAFFSEISRIVRL